MPKKIGYNVEYHRVKGHKPYRKTKDNTYPKGWNKSRTHPSINQDGTPTKEGDPVRDRQGRPTTLHPKKRVPWGEALKRKKKKKKKKTTVGMTMTTLHTKMDNMKEVKKRATKYKKRIKLKKKKS